MSAECPILPEGGYPLCKNPVVVRMYPEPIYEDPFAKVSYSDNPDFVAGAKPDHKINIPSKSQLTALKVAEAFEAIFLEGLDEEARQEVESVEDYKPLDVELALSGLSWLRKNTTSEKNPVLRPKILDTKKKLTQRHHQQFEKPASTASFSAKPARPPEISGAEARAAAKAEATARQAGYRQRFETVLGLTGFDAPETSTGVFSELCQQLTINELDDKLIAVGDVDFQARLNERVEDYMTQPWQLFNDYKLGLVLAAHDPDHEQAGVTKAYIDTITTAIAARMAKQSYRVDALTPGVVAQWLFLRGAIPETETLAELDQRKADEDVDALAYSWVREQGQNVLVKSLGAVAKDHNKQFINKLHMVADTGFNFDDEIQYNQTLDIIRQCMTREPVAGYLLNLSLGVDNDEVQRQAIDLNHTLKLLGIPSAHLGHVGYRKAGVDKGQRSSIHQNYYRFRRPAIRTRSERLSNQALEEMLADQIEAFETYATTTAEGRAHTLLGRATEFGETHQLQRHQQATTAKEA